MTRDEVEQSLKQIGFELRRNYPNSDYTWIWLNGEMVGDLNTDRMEIANEIPSVVGKSWVSVRRRYFKYKDKEAEEKIVEAIRTLKESHRKYEQKIRDDKVNAIKRYFYQRKTQKMVNDIPLEVQL